MVYFRPLTSADDFHKMALQVLARQMSAYLPTVCRKVETAIHNALVPALEASEEYQALVNGPLDAHFGLPDARKRANAIIQKAADSVHCQAVQVRARGDKLTGGLRITAIPSDFADLLALPEASLTTGKGANLPWLQWLLTAGDSIIIADYGIDFGAYPRSRSGEAIMMKGKTAWKVPIGVSGTLRDNWFTRVTATLQSQIEQAVESAL